MVDQETADQEVLKQESVDQEMLIEIGTEELPPKSLLKLSTAFAKGIVDGLKEAGLESGACEAFATPRRLAVLLKAVPNKQPDKNITKRGPAFKAAFDADGKPTKAVLGFAGSCGVSVDELEKLETDKGTWLVYQAREKGCLTSELLGEIVATSLAKLPIPKRMRWGDRDDEFVRPVKWVLLLHGKQVISATILGVESGDKTRGHRFHHAGEIVITKPSDYASLLEKEGHVIAGFKKRREIIAEQVRTIAQSISAQPVMSDELLDEVTALVEWPVALLGNFEKEFLDVPQEALIMTMQDNQKYFAVVDASEKLMPHFITVSNIESSNPDVVREGNERVIRPRFGDAVFFWEQDKKQRLSDHLDALKKVVFQKQLGSVFEKTQRVAKLAHFIAEAMLKSTAQDTALVTRAAELSKCDLMTAMVNEFPKLQGIMGRYYGLHDGEPALVANALDEQYMPRYAGDALPVGAIGQILSIADKVDTLMGIFSIGQKPTGTKDPFALRRASLGVLRIIIECKLDLDLYVLLEKAAEFLPQSVQNKEAVNDVFDYMLDRLQAYFSDQGIAVDSIDAVMVLKPHRPLDFASRIKAVDGFRELPEAASLAAANKRIRNILKKSDTPLAASVNVALLSEIAEKELHNAVSAMSDQVNNWFDQGEYFAALKELASLKGPVDHFFDDVMVMTDDEALKNNRLTLLSHLQGMFLRVADISRLQS
ncbi:MAG: glycine--tRNA ligase subunit beta [Gammaproteobacteria bacterium]|nr:glycine--tRNA ligase subunit beta [Gammaproteobacteria bacterium]